MAIGNPPPNIHSLGFNYWLNKSYDEIMTLIELDSSSFYRPPNNPHMYYRWSMEFARFLLDNEYIDTFDYLQPYQMYFYRTWIKEFFDYAFEQNNAENYIKTRVGTGAWWHDTSDMFKDDAGTTLATANLDPVGMWQDTGPNGHHVVQSSLAAKPRINTGALNGRRGVSFDGGDLLATVGNMSISTFAIWVVVSATNPQDIVYEHSVNTNTNDGVVYITDPFPDSAYIRRGGVTSSLDTPNIAGGVWRVIRHQHNGTQATHQIYYNNASVGTNATINDIGTGVATARFFVGGRFGNVVPLLGAIASLLVVSPYPDAAFIAYVDNYFADRYAIPLV